MLMHSDDNSLYGFLDYIKIIHYLIKKTAERLKRKHASNNKNKH